MKNAYVLSFAVAAVAGSMAFGQVFNGDTTGMPTWNRPVGNGPFAPNTLSSVGTATPYQVTPLTVDVSGAYSFVNTAAGWDNYSFIYEGAFNAADPLAGVMIGNDDFISIGVSAFDVTLNAGTTYYYVTTGFGNGDQGAYTVQASGEGTVSFVPTPGAAALLGLGGLVAGRRRR